MSEAKTLFSMGMLLLIFNVIMFLGVTDYIQTNGLAELSCGGLNPSNTSAITVSEFQNTSVNQCVSDESFLIYTIIGVVDVIILGVMVYLFIPFVK